MGESHSVDIIADQKPDPMADEVARLQRQPEPEPAEGGRKFAGKYNSPEELEKAYLESQRKISELTQSEPAETGGEDTAFSLKSKGEKTPPPAKIDAAQLKREMLEQGHLSDETITKLKELGIDDELLAFTTKGIEDTKTLRQREILEEFGSKQRMERIVQWAGANLDETEQRLIEEQARNLDPKVARSAIRGLIARFEASPMGQSALEGATGGPSVSGFRSNAEMTAAIGDPRYRVDEAYRREVEARIAAM